MNFYDSSVGSYLQILGGVATALERGATAAAEGGLDLEALVDYRFHDDMLPFSFQVVSVWHHSLGALRGMQSGLFEPPQMPAATGYEDLQALVSEAREQLRGFAREDVEALAGGYVVFRLGSRDIPIKAEQFLLSFSLPNFYFHASTSYTALRVHGVPLGKIDFLGKLRTGSG